MEPPWLSSEIFFFKTGTKKLSYFVNRKRWCMDVTAKTRTPSQHQASETKAESKPYRFTHARATCNHTTAQAEPNAQPPITSVAQCTPRAMRLRPTKSVIRPATSKM